MKIINNSDSVIIVLHEIYGINQVGGDKYGKKYFMVY